MRRLLEELFSKYYKDVYTYLYSLSRDPSLSEDLAQEVFLEVVKSIAAFRGESDKDLALLYRTTQMVFPPSQKQLSNPH